MSKEERELTTVEQYLLHVVVDHVAGKALPQFGTAILELESVAAQVEEDERVTKLVKTLIDASQQVSEVLREVLETIPGVVIPTVEEVKKMVNDAQAEKDFLTLLKANLPQEQLH